MPENQEAFRPSQTFRSFYDILGVPRNASLEQVRAGFRKSALETHPDHHLDDPDATRKFQDVNEANSVLSDTDKRARYDLDLPRLEEKWLQNQSEARNRTQREAEARQREERVRREEEAKKRADLLKEKERQAREEKERIKRERTKVVDEQRKADEKLIRSKGRKLGERLSWWENTNEGRTKAAQDRALVTEATRNTMGIQRFFHRYEFFQQRAYSVIGSIGANGDLHSAGVIGDKVYDAIKKIYDKGPADTSRVRIRNLEQRLREQNAAHVYAYLGGGLNNDNFTGGREQYIPESVEYFKPGTNPGYTSPADRKVYIQGFKTGWTRVENMGYEGIPKYRRNEETWDE